MRHFWRSLYNKSHEPYELRKLISKATHPEYPTSRSRTHIICDIDKTYLETQFESILQLMKIPFESAKDKVTIAGAAEFLMAVRWGTDVAPAAQEPFPRSLHFVSSSPPQLRATLQKKLRLDGLDWDSETFKNQTYNLIKGRMDLLKQHVAYKSLAILDIVKSLPEHSKVVCIGDNVESDACIYLGISGLLDGTLTKSDFYEFLKALGADPNIMTSLSSELETLPNVKITNVLIRRASNDFDTKSDVIGRLIQPFDHYFEAALILFMSGYVNIQQLELLAKTFHNKYGFSESEIARCLLRYRGQHMDKITAQRYRELITTYIPKSTEEKFLAEDESLKADDTQDMRTLNPIQLIEAARLWSSRQKSSSDSN